MRRVLTYGTFDLLHYGHIRLLKRAKALGNYLIVGLTTDEYNVLNHNETFHSYEKRKDMLEALRYVDLVIPVDNNTNKIDDIKDYKVDTIIMGEDYAGNAEYEVLKEYCNVIYLDRTDGVSTDEIIEYLNNKKKNSEEMK